MRPSSAVSGDVTYGLAAARAYERWTSPRFAPVSERLAAQAGIAAGEAVLEIAAGPGTLAQRISGRLGRGGLLVVTDRCPAMLQIARERTAGQCRLAFRELDFEAPFAFEDCSFDLVASQFGYLHTSLAGLIESARVLRVGGRLHLAFWGDGYLELALLSRARAEVGLPPIKPTPAAEVEFLLDAAGLKMATVEEVEFPARFDDARHYIEYRRALGLPAPGAERERDLEVLARAERLVELEFGRDRPVSFEWRASLVGAVRPPAAH